MTEKPNYFNYFTEIEEHFQRARGTSLFLLSPLDWALIESWKNSGVPLDAVLRGIDAAFEKWRGRRSKTQQVNSLAFCAQAVLTQAQRSPDAPSNEAADEPFQRGQIRAFLEANAVELIARPGYETIALTLRELIDLPEENLEDLERRLTTLEQRMIAIARAGESEQQALESRRDLDSQLRPYRQKMSSVQLAMLEHQFLERKLLEREQLPRLSLFYLR